MADWHEVRLLYHAEDTATRHGLIIQVPEAVKTQIISDFTSGPIGVQTYLGCILEGGPYHTPATGTVYLKMNDDDLYGLLIRDIAEPPED